MEGRVNVFRMIDNVVFNHFCVHDVGSFCIWFIAIKIIININIIIIIIN